MFLESSSFHTAFISIYSVLSHTLRIKKSKSDLREKEKHRETMVTVFWQNQPFSRKILVREATHQLEVAALFLTQAGEEKEPSGLCNGQVQRLGLAWSPARCRHWAMPRRLLCWAAVSRQVLLLQSACPPASPNARPLAQQSWRSENISLWMSTQQF